MREGQCINATILRVLTICWFWTFANLSIPLVTSAADPAPEKPKNVPGPVEQSPEQAAGGMQNLRRLRKACEADVKRMCPDVKPGGGRILQCLHEHEPDLSPVCRQAVGPSPSKP